MTSLRELGRQYLWGKTVLKEDKSRVKTMTSSAFGQSESTKGMDLEMLRMIALKEPLVLKAIYKKNKDTFKNWFIVKSKDDKTVVDKKVLNIIDDFDKKSQIRNKMFVAGVCANIYGTGFIEKIYTEHGNAKADSKPSPTSKLINLEVINSECVKERKKSGKPNDEILYPIYREGIGNEILIHPDRIEVIRIDWLPFSYFGISRINVLSNVLQSKMTADKASGDFVDWAAKGLTDLTIDGMQDEQEKKAAQVLKAHPNTLIHDEDYKVQVFSPPRVDLNSFYDYFYVNIAAGLDMPKHILTGSDIGNVTGTEVGVSAYYGDVENIQKLVFTPILERIYTELLQSYGLEWDYNIDWNPIFVDELSEANILQSRSYSSTANKSAGIISVEEARQILNEGVVFLDINKVPEPPEKPPEVKPTIEPNIEPEEKPAEKVEEVVVSHFTPFLTSVQKEMIDRERELGEKEIIEQENRIKEAKKKRGRPKRNI